jgi:hypothetical protein
VIVEFIVATPGHRMDDNVAKRRMLAILVGSKYAGRIYSVLHTSFQCIIEVHSFLF